MLKAILFDIDGVLIDSFKANLTFFERLLTHAGLPVPTRDEYRQMFHLTMADVIRHQAPNLTEAEVQKISQLGKSRKVAYPDELVTLMPYALETIQKLSQTYQLGLVTSRIKVGVFELPQLQALLPYFSAVAAFEDTVEHKPHPEPLLHALKQLKVSPSEAVYIGDAQTDMEAATAAGTRKIFFGAAAATKESNIQSLAELPKIINLL